MDDDNLIEITALAALALKIRKRKKQEKKKRFWIHPVNSDRLLKGQFYTKYNDLRNHPSKFFCYFRMSIESFDELLKIISPAITYQTTNMRKSVPPEERLAVTLRYLASGNSFNSLYFEYLLGATTIREIVKDTCQVIWTYLKPLYMPEKTTKDWLEIANEFNMRTNFPNCLGAVDGKHIRIWRPNNSGSEFYNYKGYFSIVLMALTDANYCFTSIDVGSYGSNSDSNVFKRTDFFKRLQENTLGIPERRILPNDEGGTPMPFVIVGDEAFALTEHILRPYPNRNLSPLKRIFNYRLTRARRMVECTFGILCQKWRILLRSIDVNPDFCDDIVKTCCVLHNFVRRRDGFRFEDTLYESSFESLQPIGTRGNFEGMNIRDYFAEYFTSPQGTLPWQFEKI